MRTVNFFVPTCLQDSGTSFPSFVVTNTTATPETRSQACKRTCSNRLQQSENIGNKSATKHRRQMLPSQRFHSRIKSTHQHFVVKSFFSQLQLLPTRRSRKMRQIPGTRTSIPIWPIPAPKQEAPIQQKNIPAVLSGYMSTRTHRSLSLFWIGGVSHPFLLLPRKCPD